MAAFLLDWIRQLGQISGDARILLARAAYENQWSFEEFEQIVISSAPPDALADLLNPYELAVVRRAWRDDFPSMGGGPSVELSPRWHHGRPAGELRPRTGPASETPWPPPIGHPAWGDVRDEPFIGEPVSREQASPRMPGMADPRALFHQGFSPTREDASRPSPGRTGKGMSTFACGAMHPLPATHVVPGTAAQQARRPMSAPPGRRVAESSRPRWGAAERPGPAGFRRGAKQQYKAPVTASRCSGQTPWWQGSAWSTTQNEVETPPDRPLPQEWAKFAGYSLRERDIFGPRQDWIPTPLTAARGRRLASAPKGDLPRWR